MSRLLSVRSRAWAFQAYFSFLVCAFSHVRETRTPSGLFQEPGLATSHRSSNALCDLASPSSPPCSLALHANSPIYLIWPIACLQFVCMYFLTCVLSPGNSRRLHFLLHLLHLLHPLHPLHSTVSLGSMDWTPLKSKRIPHLFGYFLMIFVCLILVLFFFLFLFFFFGGGGGGLEKRRETNTRNSG